MPMSMQSTRMEQHHHRLGYTNGAAMSPVGAGMHLCQIHPALMPPEPDDGARSHA